MSRHSTLFPCFGISNEKIASVVLLFQVATLQRTTTTIKRTLRSCLSHYQNFALFILFFFCFAFLRFVRFWVKFYTFNNSIQHADQTIPSLLVFTRFYAVIATVNVVSSNFFDESQPSTKKSGKIELGMKWSKNKNDFQLHHHNRTLDTARTHYLRYIYENPIVTHCAHQGKSRHQLYSAMMMFCVALEPSVIAFWLTHLHCLHMSRKKNHFDLLPLALPFSLSLLFPPISLIRSFIYVPSLLTSITVFCISNSSTDPPTDRPNQSG